jgi:mannose-6-phosphate isomerase-like protein (cupin superfamily)
VKVIKKSAAVSFTNSSACAGFEFAFGDDQLNIALVTVNGRYPKRGHLVNEVCKEIAFVVKGSGIVGVDGEKHSLSVGDAVMIQPGERFYWEGQKLQMLMPCSPAFYPEQHKEVR